MCMLYLREKKKSILIVSILNRFLELYLCNWIYDEGYGSLINSKEEDILLPRVKDNAM